MKFFTKITFALLLFTFLAAGVTAQTLRIKGGLSLATVHESIEGEKVDNDFTMLPGYVLGTSYIFDGSGAIDFETGLLFVSKGIKAKETQGDARIVVRAVTHNIEIPFQARYTFEQDNFSPFVGAGLYAAFGLSGQATYIYEDENSKSKESEDLNFGTDESDDLKPFDVGLQFSAGVTTGKLEFAMTYELGLANLSTYTDFENKMNNRVLMITAGYQIK